MTYQSIVLTVTFTPLSIICDVLVTFPFFLSFVKKIRLQVLTFLYFISFSEKVSQIEYNGTKINYFCNVGSKIDQVPYNSCLKPLSWWLIMYTKSTNDGAWVRFCPIWHSVHTFDPSSKNAGDMVTYLLYPWSTTYSVLSHMIHK